MSKLLKNAKKIKKQIDNNNLMATMLTSMEWGFIAHEKGMNLEMARIKFMELQK